MKSQAELQREEKYKHHDWHIDDLTDWDLGVVRGMALDKFIKSRQNDNVKVTIDAFLTFLASKGFKVTKKESK